MLSILYSTLLESAPYVVLGFIIAGIIRFYLPQQSLYDNIGRGDTLSLLKSVGVGALLPICSCGTIPLGIGLYRSGAAVGNILAFMTSTPILSPILVALAFKLLGVNITVTLLCTSVIGALTIGFIANRLFTNKSISKSCGDCSCEKEHKPKERPVGGVLGMLRWSLFDLGASVGVDIVIGLGIASLIISILPMEWISMWLGQQNFSTLIYVILLGIPVYACSIPSVAVVQSLLLLGASPGAAIAYMIAGPATNLGELNAIRRSVGMREAMFYAGALIVLALVAGLITDNLVFPDYQYHAFRDGGDIYIRQCCIPMIFGDTISVSSVASSTPLWHYPFGVVLFAVIGYGLYIKLKYFFVNPCKKCVWRGYGENDHCGGKCHVRRKYEFVHRFIK